MNNAPWNSTKEPLPKALFRLKLSLSAFGCKASKGLSELGCHSLTLAPEPRLLLLCHLLAPRAGSKALPSPPPPLCERWSTLTQQHHRLQAQLLVSLWKQVWNSAITVCCAPWYSFSLNLKRDVRRHRNQEAQQVRNFWGLEEYSCFHKLKTIPVVLPGIENKSTDSKYIPSSTLQSLEESQWAHLWQRTLSVC